MYVWRERFIEQYTKVTNAKKTKALKPSIKVWTWKQYRILNLVKSTSLMPSYGIIKKISIKVTSMLLHQLWWFYNLVDLMVWIFIKHLIFHTFFVTALVTSCFEGAFITTYYITFASYGYVGNLFWVQMWATISQVDLFVSILFNTLKLVHFAAII